MGFLRQIRQPCWNMARHKWHCSVTMQFWCENTNLRNQPTNVERAPLHFHAVKLIHLPSSVWVRFHSRRRCIWGELPGAADPEGEGIKIGPYIHTPSKFWDVTATLAIFCKSFWEQRLWLSGTFSCNSGDFHQHRRKKSANLNSEEYAKHNCCRVFLNVWFRNGATISI